MLATLPFGILSTRRAASFAFSSTYKFSTYEYNDVTGMTSYWRLAYNVSIIHSAQALK